MSEKLGNVVSRTLSAYKRQFSTVIMQQKKVPLDADLNLKDQIRTEDIRKLIQANTPSGFFLDPTRAGEDFVTSKQWSNFFKLGASGDDELSPAAWASVNGWMIPVTGTQTTGTDNVVRLYPPPESGTRVDFVFLEVWDAVISGNPSTENKPSQDKFWTYGNVEFGGVNLDDNMKDPAIGHEASKRGQLQYRIRVVGSGDGLGTSIGLDDYPDGLGHPSVLAQGTASAPISSFVYENMRNELGDPGLWRAGDGNPDSSLGTIDGYSYAVPICSIFRRNTSSFLAINAGGNPEHNGSFDRNPSARLLSDPREGAKSLKTPTLATLVEATTSGEIILEVNDLAGSGFDDSQQNLSSMFLLLDGEIMGISEVNSASSPATITIPSGGRGRRATSQTRHEVGSKVSIYSLRPGDLFADEIASTDILNMRRGINFGDWDFQRILSHNLTLLIQNELQTSHKSSAVSDAQGILIPEVSFMDAVSTRAVPSHTAGVDGPDGIRSTWSDAATLQTDITLLLDHAVATTDGFTNTNFDQSLTWDVGAGFLPLGFMNNVNQGSLPGFKNGSSIFFHIGGSDGSAGARQTFRSDEKNSVRFVSPVEYWKGGNASPQEGKQHPFSLRFLKEKATTAAPPAHDEALSPGPMYPLPEFNFEAPFVVLGALVNSALSFTGLSGNSASSSTPGLLVNLEIDLGASVNFNTGFGGLSLDPDDAGSLALLGGSRTLWDLLTKGGSDLSGSSSELYVVLQGDGVEESNNGAFKVVGAGTIGYTSQLASSANGIIVEPLTPGVADWSLSSVSTITVQFRSQFVSAEDGTGLSGSTDTAALCVVLTDIQGELGDAANPWNSVGSIALGANALPSTIDSELLINCTLLYSPGRGATPRVPRNITQFAIIDAGLEYLNQNPKIIDAAFPVPQNETYYETANLQLWNRLPSRGLTESSNPKAPNFGGEVVAFSEQDREHSLFIDKGSKTVIFRPLMRREMTFRLLDFPAYPISVDPEDASLVGAISYPTTLTNKDPAGLFNGSLDKAYQVPSEYMPRFGRQNIPYYQDVTANGSGAFLEGINHLFLDDPDSTKPVFNIVGGFNNTTGGNQVTSLYLKTKVLGAEQYGDLATLTVGGGPGIINTIQSRLLSDIPNTPQGSITKASLQRVISSDLGGGLNGIQLPPHMGLSRVYGVYELENFQDSGASTWAPDRVTPDPSPANGFRAINLMKEDNLQQSLFILEGGARDLTDHEGDHTYVIPENLIDITKAPSYAPGLKDKFSDFSFVVECVVFGFARDFINGNNLVLTRRNNGQGDDPVLVAAGQEVNGAGCILHAAPSLNDRLYVLYDRVPYQGDPYSTKSGETQTTSDYVNRYGQVRSEDSFELNASIEQYDSSGAIQVETPNSRALQVLASLDFFTTLGTGKIGGKFYPGTPLDIGHIENSPAASSRIAQDPSQPLWRTKSRAFSEGQESNTSRARLSIEVITSGASLTSAPVTVSVIPSSGSAVVFTAFNGATVDANEFDASGSTAQTAANLAGKIQAHPLVVNKIVASRADDNRVEIQAIPVGLSGNGIRIEIKGMALPNPMRILREARGDELLLTNRSASNLIGGRNIPVNAGDGFSQLQLTGLIERLPLGILAQDSDFICENPLGDNASAFKSNFASIRPVQNFLPLTSDGDEFERFFGGPGQIVALSDGAILQYRAFDQAERPTGTKRFRLYRGGGSVFTLSGRSPGGPVDWQSDSLPASLQPVLKGAVLACKALLVRNFPETAFTEDVQTTNGDEIQMVILTHAIYGNGGTQQDGISLGGSISPTGYGEGYSAADRYRLDGKPMYSGASSAAPDPEEVTLAVYPGRPTQE